MFDSTFYECYLLSGATGSQSPSLVMLVSRSAGSRPSTRCWARPTMPSISGSWESRFNQFTVYLAWNIVNIVNDAFVRQSEHINYNLSHKTGVYVTSGPIKTEFFVYYWL